MFDINRGVLGKRLSMSKFKVSYLLVGIEYIVSRRVVHSYY
jgi:hypothetical protein